MSNIAEIANENIQKFKLSPGKFTGESTKARNKFLNNLKSTFPSHETFDGLAKENCLILDDNGMIFASTDDQLFHSSHLNPPRPLEFGYHKNVAYMKSCPETEMIVTASADGIFIVWDYRSKNHVKTIQTKFSHVNNLEIKNKSQFFILEKSELILVDFKNEKYLCIPELQEGQKIPGEENWENLLKAEKKAAENAPEDISDVGIDIEALASDVENKIIESTIKFMEVNQSYGKKTRKSSILRQNYLTATNEYKQKIRSRILYIKSSSMLIWAKNMSLIGIDFVSRKYTICCAIPAVASCLSTNNDESMLFVGLKTGVIKYFDAKDLTEQGELIGHTNEITSIVNSKGKHRLVFSAGMDDTVRVWHLGLLEEIGQLIKEIWHIGTGESLGGHKSDKVGVSSSKMKLIQKYKRGKNKISDLVISADEEHLFCVFNHQNFKWNINFHYKDFEYSDDNPELRKSVLGNQNPQFLYSVENREISQINVVYKTTIQKGKQLLEEISCLAISRNDLTLAAGLNSGCVMFINVSDLSFKFEAELTNQKIDKIEFFKEQYVIVTTADGSLFIYDILCQQKYELMKHFQKVTAIFMSESQEYLFTAGHDLILRKWDLKPLADKCSPLEVLNFPIEFPVHALSIDIKRNLLYYSQREMVTIFDIHGQEVLGQIFPANISDLQGHLHPLSKQVSQSIVRFSCNVDEFVYDLISTATREEFSVKGIYQLPEYNVVVVVRANGNFTCWDSATRENLIDFYTSEKIQKVFKPNLSNLIFCFTDKNTIECINVFRLNFFDCCYIQTFSEKMNENDFEKKMLSFYELAKDSPFIYKILHPIYLAFLLNKFQTIGAILKQWGYPVLNSSQPSPLILSLEGRHVNFAESLFRELTLYKGKLVFRYLEIKCMLEHDYKFVKRLLVKVCQKLETYTNTDEKIKNYNCLKNEKAQFLSYSGHFTKKNLDNYVLENVPDYFPIFKEVVSEENDEVEENDINDREEKRLLPGNRTIQTVESKQSLAPKKTYTEVYRINGFYNFKRGSDDVLNFLYRYSESKIDEFVLSDWSRIVNQKWDDCKIYFRILGFIFFSFLLFLNLLMLFPSERVYLWIVVGLLSVLLFYEVVPLLIYRQYYSYQANSMMDLAMYLLTIITVVWLHRSPDPDNMYLQTLEVVNDSLAFYKGISYLRMFDSMRSMTHMINSLISGSKDVIVMIVYLLVTFTVLMNIVSYDQGFYMNLIWSIFMSFCNFPSDFDPSFINLFVIVSVMFCLTLIMINFMIAKMANTYNELVKKQKATNFKQMAKILFEFEIWFRIFFLKRSDRKYMTYYIMGTSEPDYKLGTMEAEASELAGAYEFQQNLMSLGEQLERIEIRSQSLTTIKQEMLKLHSSTKFTGTYKDIKEINSKLSKLLETEKASFI